MLGRCRGCLFAARDVVVGLAEDAASAQLVW